MPPLGQKRAATKGRAVPPPRTQPCRHQGQSRAAHLVGDGDAGLVEDRPSVVAGGLVGVAFVVLEERQLK